jgi:hypothetical protein
MVVAWLETLAALIHKEMWYFWNNITSSPTYKDDTSFKPKKPAARQAF